MFVANKYKPTISLEVLFSLINETLVDLELKMFAKFYTLAVLSACLY